MFFYLCRFMEKLQEILVKVSEQFRKYGIKSMTMDDVARELGISKKTLYQYVADKTDLINKLIDYEIETAVSQFNNVLKTELNAIEELFEINRFMAGMIKRNSASFDFDLKKYYPDIFQRVQSIRRNKIFNATLENLKKGKIQGLYRQELNEEVLTKLHVFRIENIHNSAIFNMEEISSGIVFKEIFVYHIRGISNEKGIKFLEKNIHKLDYKEIF